MDFKKSKSTELNEEKIAEQEIENHQDASGKQKNHNNSNQLIEKLENSEPEQNVHFNIASKNKSEDRKQENLKLIQSELEEGIYISNAGLVLLAPFLPFYLEALGLVKDKKFISTEAQERAVLLSQYLVKDQTQISEYELLLNKVIMDWELDEPLTSTIIPTEKEKQESQDLLQSLLNHWGALGNSGIAALQETFLQREGKFISKDDQYKLIVERKSLDLLMDKIPWSFTTIKLPWMEKRIQVEW